MRSPVTTQQQSLLDSDLPRSGRRRFPMVVK